MRKIEIAKRYVLFVISLFFAALGAVLAFFCKFDFSMIKYSVLWSGTTIFRLSCLSYNIARIFRHVKGGLVRDRKIYPWTWRKICAK